MEPTLSFPPLPPPYVPYPETSQFIVIQLLLGGKKYLSLSNELELELEEDIEIFTDTEKVYLYNHRTLLYTSNNGKKYYKTVIGKLYSSPLFGNFRFYPLTDHEMIVVQTNLTKLLKEKCTNFLSHEEFSSL